MEPTCYVCLEEGGNRTCACKMVLHDVCRQRLISYGMYICTICKKSLVSPPPSPSPPPALQIELQPQLDPITTPTLIPSYISSLIPSFISTLMLVEHVCICLFSCICFLTIVCLGIIIFMVTTNL